MPLYQPRIAIAGAGPAGLTLGVLLHQRKIPFTIYELRSKPTDAELAKPSGSLDLHEESGLAAIRACGLYDKFVPLTGECSEANRIGDRHGNIVYADQGEAGGRPEISRHALTRLLLSGLPPQLIKWDHKLVGVSSSSSSRASTPATITLDFGPAHGTETCDLVIGADGAWSKVRSSLLSTAAPHYSGIQMMTTTIANVDKYPHLADYVGPGSFMGLAGGNGLMVQRSTGGAMRMYLAISTPHASYPQTMGFGGRTPTEIKGALLSRDELFGTWGALPKELIGAACDEETAANPGVETDFRPMYMLPVGHRWDYRAGATAIGDAAHLIPPWAGEGVNLAMWDSLDLSRTLAEAVEGKSFQSGAEFQRALEAPLRKFEADMADRAKEKAEETLENKERMFTGEDPAKAMADWMTAAFAQLAEMLAAQAKTEAGAPGAAEGGQ